MGASGLYPLPFSYKRKKFNGQQRFISVMFKNKNNKFI
jgi:hypothetical protein